MKKKIKPSETKNDNMLAEYDFTEKKGVRGKYYRAYRQGHTVKIYQNDETVSVQYFTSEDGSVMLDPDVRKYFPDSEAVNTALRSLIAIIQHNPEHNNIIKKKPDYGVKCIDYAAYYFL